MRFAEFIVVKEPPICKELAVVALLDCLSKLHQLRKCKHACRDACVDPRDEEVGVSCPLVHVEDCDNAHDDSYANERVSLEQRQAR